MHYEIEMKNNASSMEQYYWIVTSNLTNSKCICNCINRCTVFWFVSNLECIIFISCIIIEMSDLEDMYIYMSSITRDILKSLLALQKISCLTNQKVNMMRSHNDSREFGIFDKHVSNKFNDSSCSPHTHTQQTIAQ